MTSTEECNHVWMKVLEQNIIGMTSPDGWECEKCGKTVSRDGITPAGLPGSVGTKSKLYGLHRCGIATDTGKRCTAQIWDEATKELTYIGAEEQQK